MNFDLKKLGVLLVTGIVGAAVADIDAWRKGADESGTLPKFDIWKAVPRWIMGGVSGVMGYFGLGTLGA